MSLENPWITAVGVWGYGLPDRPVVDVYELAVFLLPQQTPSSRLAGYPPPPFLLHLTCHYPIFSPQNKPEAESHSGTSTSPLRTTNTEALFK